MKPRQFDSEALLELVHEAYDCASSSEGFAPLARSLREFLHAQYVGLTRHSREVTFAVGDASEPKFLKDYRAHFHRFDPYCDQVAARLHVGDVSFVRDLMLRGDLMKTEFYNDFMQTHHLEDGVAGVVDRNASGQSVLTIFHEKSNWPRGDEERHFLAQLVPHLQRAIDLHDRCARLDSEARLGKHLVDQLGCAVFVVESDCRILRLNALAERMLEGEDGVGSYAGRLSASHSEDARALRRAVASFLSLHRMIEVPRILRIHRPSGRAPLIASLALLTSKSAEPLMLGQGQVVVLIRDPDGPTRRSAEALKQALGLTVAEARLVAVLVEGETVAAAARQLGISIHTARTQLKAAFAKTGTHRQPELVRLALLAVAP